MAASHRAVLDAVGWQAGGRTVEFTRLIERPEDLPLTYCLAT